MVIVLFHSALGLRRAESDTAAALRADGHQVVTPDLYDGEAAETLERGLALKDVVGWDTICERAQGALADLPDDIVLAGVSMGAGVVSEMWKDRPSTRAVILIHGYAPIPDQVAVGVRASLHVAVGDPFAPDQSISEWRLSAAARGIEAQVHRYPDVGHFFTDPASGDYDQAAAHVLRQQVCSFLRDLPSQRKTSAN